MNIDEIKQVAEMMQDFDLCEFKLVSEEITLSMRRGAVSAPVAQLIAAPAAPAPVAPALPVGDVPASPATPAVQAVVTIDSPIVGTFYCSPSPEAAAYVKVGSEVNPETVVCIVEAMKVMNEIKAEASGVIRKILVKNATPVEFGQPLFEIAPVE